MLTELLGGCADVNILCNLGSLLFEHSKEYGRAQEAFEHVLKLEPERGDVMSNLALVFAAQDRLDEAEDMYKRAIAHSVCA